jgi:asparagine N-glycosylation enzyme membrane subunit Stt3
MEIPKCHYCRRHLEIRSSYKYNLYQKKGEGEQIYVCNEKNCENEADKEGFEPVETVLGWVLLGALVLLISIVWEPLGILVFGSLLLIFVLVIILLLIGAITSSVDFCKRAGPKK